MIRSMVQVLLSENFDDVQQLLRSIFRVVYSKTDGYMADESETYSEKGRKFLRQRIASGVISEVIEQNQILEDKLNDNIQNSFEESETDCIEIDKNKLNTVCFGTIEVEKNPFYSRIKSISLTSQDQIANEKVTTTIYIMLLI